MVWVEASGSWSRASNNIIETAFSTAPAIVTLSTTTNLREKLKAPFLANAPQRMGRLVQVCIPLVAKQQPLHRNRKASKVPLQYKQYLQIGYFCNVYDIGTSYPNLVCDTKNTNILTVYQSPCRVV